MRFFMCKRGLTTNFEWCGDFENLWHNDLHQADKSTVRLLLENRNNANLVYEFATKLTLDISKFEIADFVKFSSEKQYD
ncbi:hypothetical protein BpHYR1_006804 [Brachionus plicatilis]|uniref:Uncharacterized protein n=1 Tax=Brachionus plicatilis TaxID=10195 RepID=A0A3M7QDT2_BRAPC|nr:hypothetical protein BpHYR1_006804 [Brachionus plicatilis]